MPNLPINSRYSVQRKQALQMFNDGHSLITIAAATHIRIATLCDWFGIFGIDAVLVRILKTIEKSKGGAGATIAEIEDLLDSLGGLIEGKLVLIVLHKISAKSAHFQG